MTELEKAKGIQGAKLAAIPYEEEARELERARTGLKALIKYAHEDLKLVTTRHRQVSRVAKALRGPRAGMLADRVREAYARWSTAGPEGKKSWEKKISKVEGAYRNWFNRLWASYKGPGGLSHVTKRFGVDPTTGRLL